MILLADEHFRETWSISCLVSLSKNPTFITAHQNTNDQLDFLWFIVEALEAGELQRGDYLIVDNAAIHGGKETIEILDDLLKSAGVTMKFLPKYSPELNPAELVFSLVKTTLRQHRKKDLPLLLNIAAAFSCVTLEQVYSFYKHCLCSFGEK